MFGWCLKPYVKTTPNSSTGSRTEYPKYLSTARLVLKYFCRRYETTMTPSKRSVSFPLWRARNDNGDSSETTTELPFEDTEVDVIHGDADEGFAIAYGLKRYVLDRTDVVALFGSDCNFDGLVVMVNKEAALVRDDLGDIRTGGCVTVCCYEKIVAAANGRTMVKKPKPTAGKRKRKTTQKASI